MLCSPGSATTLTLLAAWSGPAKASLELSHYHVVCHSFHHTPSIAFRHLPPNSARFSYATEGALFISAQLSSDAVSALRKVLVLI